MNRVRKKDQPEVTQRAFTLVELLIVIVVIGIIAAISIVAYRGSQEKARTTAVVANVQSYVEALDVMEVRDKHFVPGSACIGALPPSGDTCLYLTYTGAQCQARYGVAPGKYSATPTQDGAFNEALKPYIGTIPDRIQYAPGTWSAGDSGCTIAVTSTSPTYMSWTEIQISRSTKQETYSSLNNNAPTAYTIAFFLPGDQPCVIKGDNVVRKYDAATNVTGCNVHGGKITYVP